MQMPSQRQSAQPGAFPDVKLPCFTPRCLKDLRLPSCHAAWKLDVLNASCAPPVDKTVLCTRPVLLLNGLHSQRARVRKGIKDGGSSNLTAQARLLSCLMSPLASPSIRHGCTLTFLPTPGAHISLTYSNLLCTDCHCSNKQRQLNQRSELVCQSGLQQARVHCIAI